MILTKKQSELLQNLVDMPRGTILRKGNRERILWSVGPGYIFYKTKSKPKETTMVHVTSFMKWAEKAEIVEEEKAD